MQIFPCKVACGKLANLHSRRETPIGGKNLVDRWIWAMKAMEIVILAIAEDRLLEYLKLIEAMKEARNVKVVLLCKVARADLILETWLHSLRAYTDLSAYPIWVEDIMSIRPVMVLTNTLCTQYWQWKICRMTSPQRRRKRCAERTSGLLNKGAIQLWTSVSTKLESQSCTCL